MTKQELKDRAGWFNECDTMGLVESCIEIIYNMWKYSHQSDVRWYPVTGHFIDYDRVQYTETKRYF